LDFAVEIASVSRASIILVYVYNLVDTPFREKNALEIKYGLPMEQAAREELELICSGISDSLHIEISSQLYGGTVVSSVLDAATDNGADLIIMGTLGDTGFKEKLIGSITAAVISKSAVPVMAVPLLSEWDIPKNILLAVNHFDETTGNAKPVFKLARYFNSKVIAAVFTDQDTADAEAYIENARGIYSYEKDLEEQYKDVPIEPVKLYGHKFQEAIDGYIENNKVDMLAMFTHKRNFVESIFNRSVTKKMSYHTNIPLLAIPVN
jgi:nucleotide-binding universal stress UspA family protein